MLCFVSLAAIFPASPGHLERPSPCPPPRREQTCMIPGQEQGSTVRLLPHSPAHVLCFCSRRWHATRPPFQKLRHSGRKFPGEPAGVLLQGKTRLTLAEGSQESRCKGGRDTNPLQSLSTLTIFPRVDDGHRAQRSFPLVIVHAHLDFKGRQRGDALVSIGEPGGLYGCHLGLGPSC